MKRFLYLPLLCLGSSIPGAAGTVTWSSNAAGTYDFFDVANWTGGALPGASDTANFAAPAGDQLLRGAATPEAGAA